MTTTKNQRFVVRASSMRFSTSSVPTCRAVSKPKVGMSPGRGMSLSMVLGAWMTRTAPSVTWASRVEAEAMPSPPMVSR